jgi:hypothetical protein
VKQYKYVVEMARDWYWNTLLPTPKEILDKVLKECDEHPNTLEYKLMLVAVSYDKDKIVETWKDIKKAFGLRQGNRVIWTESQDDIDNYWMEW